MMKLNRTKAVLLGLVAATAATPLLANHSWNGYHWLRTAQEVTPSVGDNVDSNWDSYLRDANADWNQSTVINSPLVAGTTNPKNCKAVPGTIQVCNSRYGQTGWLGIASIWLSGGHISQGTTKLNDTYFNSAKYNTPDWRALVTCQEVGHDYGLGHQDEDFNTDNTNSCMDYTNFPAGNTTPDSHDYAELLSIYDHFDSASATVFGRGASNAGAESGDSPADWGRAVHFDRQGRPDYFMMDLGNGQKKVTHVFWALGESPRRMRD